MAIARVLIGNPPEYSVDKIFSDATTYDAIIGRHFTAGTKRPIFIVVEIISSFNRARFVANGRRYGSWSGALIGSRLVSDANLSARERIPRDAGDTGDR